MTLTMTLYDRRFEVRVYDFKSKKQKSFSIPDIKQFSGENAESLIKKIKRGIKWIRKHQ